MTKPTSMIARSTEDLLAMVPYVLGFHPEESAVMLTFGDGPANFHARIDLPEDREDLPGFVEAVIEPAQRHGVQSVALVAYTDDQTRADWALFALHDALDALDVDVIDMMRVHDDHWFPLRDGLPDHLYAGVPFDATTHRFMLQSVVEGRVTHGSRQALADTLVVTDPAAVEAVEDAVMEAMRAWAGVQRAAEGSRACAMVRRHVAANTSPSAAEVGRLLVGCCDLTIRDSVWSLMSMATAEAHVAFWVDVVRRTPVDCLAAPSALLAFAAWLAGHGALAWCALDRAALAEPDYGMAATIAAALEGAVPPSAWESTRPQTQSR